jgi:hypothetical protein
MIRRQRAMARAQPTLHLAVRAGTHMAGAGGMQQVGWAARPWEEWEEPEVWVRAVEVALAAARAA